MRTEGGAGCACGAVAVANTILAFVEQGDHVDAVDQHRLRAKSDLLHQNPAKLGVTTSWFDPLIGEEIAARIQPNTKSGVS